MRVIVAGSRTFSDFQILSDVLDKVFQKYGNDLVIISGTAVGADQMGEFWALAYNVPVEKFPAKWNEHGRRAGYIRNEQMASRADALIAFWDGKSKGTMHMINIAKREGLYTSVIYV